jgi:hypothetical protein
MFNDADGDARSIITLEIQHEHVTHQTHTRSTDRT